MNNLMILTPDCEEKIVYRIDNQDTQIVLQKALKDLSCYVEIYNPQLINFNLDSISPLKGLKSKNNSRFKTSVKVSCNDYTFECIMYSSNRDKKQWIPMNEEYMQLDIIHLPTKSLYTFYALKNFFSESSNSFCFFNDDSSAFPDSLPLLTMLSHEINLKINYLSIFKKILTMEHSDDFKQVLDTSTLKEELINNEKFLFICMTNYSNPVCIFNHMLEENIIKTKWKNGQEFIKSLELHTKVDKFYHSLIESYNSFILHNTLQKCVQNKMISKNKKKI